MSLEIGPVSEPLLITVDEFADLMQLSVRTIWRLCSSGQVPKPVRIGGTVRWRHEEVRKWIADGCPKTSTSEFNRLR